MTALGDLLTEVEDYLGTYVAYPNAHAVVAHVLWVAHTHTMDAWESTPRLAFLSPEPGSGKSRALEATEPLVPRPIHALNTTAAYLFRKVSDEAGPPTLLYDEIDTVFTPRGGEAEDIRGMLNGGHRKGATAGRCVTRGNTILTEEFPSYCAVALAGLNDLPATIADRAILIRMRRRAPDEQVRPFRIREAHPIGEALRERLSDCLGPLAYVLADQRPDMPDGVTDRAADVWEPLLAVADVAGGSWPERARRCAVAHVADSSEALGQSLGVRLLRDLREVFGTHECLSTDSILESLHSLDESPWADLRGSALDARGLSRRLGKYGIHPKVVRIGEKTPRGYRAADLADAWTRYLPATSATSTSETDPPRPSTRSATSATTKQSEAILTEIDGCQICHEPLDPWLIDSGTNIHLTCGVAS